MTNISVLILTVCVLLNGYVQGLNIHDAAIKRHDGQDERVSCPQQVNCAGKTKNCSSDSSCADPPKCCIDKVLGYACCIDPAVIPPSPPATPPIAAPTPSPVSVCSGLTSPCPSVPATEANGCECSTGADCYDNEICCIDLSKPPIQPFCHLKDPQPTTPKPGNPCPTSVLSKPCQRPIIDEDTDGDFCDAANANSPKCGNGQICCRKDRYSSACCLIYP